MSADCVRCDGYPEKGIMRLVKRRGERIRVCQNCGYTGRHPVRRLRRRVIGGKRGRNSGKVSTAKSK